MNDPGIELTYCCITVVSDLSLKCESFLSQHENKKKIEIFENIIFRLKMKQMISNSKII